MKKIGLIGIIIDGTYSFAQVYPVVYYGLEQLLLRLEAKNPDVELRYGITVIHDIPEPIPFRAGEYYTTDIKEIMRELVQMEFYEGGIEGECLNEAVSQQLQQLNRATKQLEQSDEVVYRELLMFTDSIPEDGDLMPDFTCEEPGVYGTAISYGLQYAQFYSYRDDYMPVLRMVDTQGKLTENSVNECIYGSLSLWMDGRKERIDELADRMLQALSAETH